ncbi:MAG: AMP-binding protein, partial [Methylocystis sp.]|nr:AMP-binding protein [Methylocystis sp.]
MIPAAFVFLDSLPLTSNGKIDRRALPEPNASDRRSIDYIAPRTALEESICRVWADVLGLPRVGVRDNFFELGGHSLLAMTLIERMRRSGFETDVRTLFTRPTPEELAGTKLEANEIVVPTYSIPSNCRALTPEMLPLAQLTQSEIDRIVETTPGGVANVQDIYPLAPLQEGILFHHVSTTGGDPYLIPTVLGFDSRSRVEEFCSALQAVIARHDILRTSIVWEGLREPMQVVWRNAPLEIEEVAINPSDGDAAEQLIARVNPRHYRLDVRRAPMIRLFVARDAINDRWIVALLNHHLVDDVSSLGFIFEEIVANLSSDNISLPAPTPFRNFVAQAKFGVRTEEHEAFFKKMLEDVSEPTIPFGLDDIQSDGWNAREARLDLSAALAGRIRTIARTIGVSPASLFHLAFAQVLARASGRDDVVFGTVLFGRMHGAKGSDRAIGIFINTLPIRIRIDARGVSTCVRSVHEQLTLLMRHEHASLALAQRCSQVTAPTPLFSALLNYRHAIAEKEMQRGTLALEGVTELYSDERSNYPFDISVDDLGDGFRLTAQTHTPVDPEKVCACLGAALDGLVEALETAPNTPSFAIGVLPKSEIDALTHICAGNTYPADPPFDVVALFQEMAMKSPDGAAVIGDGVTLSYGEIDARSNQLARALIDRGGAPETLIGICLERSPEIIVAVLGVLKAGAAYLPLDPSYPPERLAFMIGDAQPLLTITREALVGRLPEGASPFILDAIANSRGESAEPIPLRAAADNLAYVIYTSGSTGKPKGASITRGNLFNLTRGQILFHRFDANDRLLQLASLSFDMSVEEIFPALCAGAALVLAPARFTESWERFNAFLHDNAVTFVNAPTAVWRDFTNWIAKTGARLPQNLRALAVGGEAADIGTLRLWRSLETDAIEWTNSYGPTETTVNAASYRLIDDPENLFSVPIGRAVDNTRLYILDRWLEPAPLGVAGEICVAGVQVG